jgi:signal transduction histidine kinase
MTPSQQQRIFEPFYTTRRATGGSGLGLATVRTIVSGHGGQVGLESRVGQGTIFLLNFPAMEPEAETTPRA